MLEVSRGREVRQEREAWFAESRLMSSPDWGAPDEDHRLASRSFRQDACRVRPGRSPSLSPGSPPSNQL